MIDITGTKIGPDGNVDLELYDTQTTKAANVLSVQLGTLEYLPLFGIDLAYFLNSSFDIQNESFRAYMVEVLANNGINVASVMTTVQTLTEFYSFNLTPDDSSSGLIAR